MDSHPIGSVAATSGASMPATAPTQSSTAATKSGATQAADAKHADAATANVAEPAVPQRDPRSLQYQVDGTTHRVVATIVDDGDNTVVRQIPDAEVLRIAQAIDRMQGFLLEERA